MCKEYQMTEEGKKELEEELEYILKVKRPEIIERIKTAREFGDLSENSEYDAARDEQASVESRIQVIENMLNHAELIKKRKTNKVQFGSVVTFKDIKTKKESIYQIVGIAEANPSNNKISLESPVAKALLGNEKGNTVVIHLPGNKERKIKILEIK